MKLDQAVEIAKAVAESEGWRWEEPIHVRKSRRGWFKGTWEWHVHSNAEWRGCNVYIVVDDVTGEVSHKAFLPR